MFKGAFFAHMHATASIFLPWLRNSLRNYGSGCILEKTFENPERDAERLITRVRARSGISLTCRDAHLNSLSDSRIQLVPLLPLQLLLRGRKSDETSVVSPGQRHRGGFMRAEREEESRRMGANASLCG